jgi:hypothetical protein
MSGVRKHKKINQKLESNLESDSDNIEGLIYIKLKRKNIP